MKAAALLFALLGVGVTHASQRLIEIDGKKIVAEISPDGSLATWAHYVEGDYNIHVSKPDGSESRSLTPPGGSWAVSPSWAPDGKNIVFKWHDGYGYGQAYLTDPEGKSFERLTLKKHGVRIPRFNKKGALAVLSLHKEAGHPHYRRSDLAVIEDGEWSDIVKDKMIIDYAWSPDGTNIACGTEDEVIITNLSSGDSRSFAISDIDEQLYQHSCVNLRWQPDGKAVACLIRYQGRRVAPETVLPGEDKFYLLSTTEAPRPVALKDTRREPFKWVRFRPDIPIQLDTKPVDPRVEKKRVIAYFEAKGYPLKEIKAPGNYIEYGFEVGPDGKHAIGINILLTEADKRARAPQLYSIPSHTEKDIVLWYWDLKTNGNGHPGFDKFHARLLKVLKEYPGK